MARHSMFSLLVSLLAARTAAKCAAYGIDFQGGGTYFQNISSTSAFTFVTTFKGCEPDVASNILYNEVDEWECTDTSLRPDDTNQLSTCNVNKNQLSTGPWGVVIISNNGNGAPAAFDRKFSIIAGEPATTTYTPTITATVVSTPMVNSTSSTTTTATITTTTTTTLAAHTRAITITVRPPPVTITKTIGPTLSLTKYVHQPLITTVTASKTCKVSTQTSQDPTLTWLPSLLPTALVEPLVDLLGIADALPNFLLARDEEEEFVRVPVDRAQRIAERKARISRTRLRKRAPDSSTTTLTETNPSSFSTVTSTSLAAPSTITVPFILTRTDTTTSIATAYSGRTTLPPTYVTLPARTVTRWKATIFTTTVATVTKKSLVTITVPNAGAATSCRQKGGRLM